MFLRDFFLKYPQKSSKWHCIFTSHQGSALLTLALWIILLRSFLVSTILILTIPVNTYFTFHILTNIFCYFEHKVNNLNSNSLLVHIRCVFHDGVTLWGKESKMSDSTLWLVCWFEIHYIHWLISDNLLKMEKDVRQSGWCGWFFQLLFWLVDELLLSLQNPFVHNASFNLVAIFLHFHL